MNYGQLPKDLGTFEVGCQEMMFYQYLPIKMPGETKLIYEDCLKPFDALVGAACCDYVGDYGLDKYVDSYVYLTAKYLFQSPGCPFNRTGYHADGFLTDDVNYLWSDKYPTIFNNSIFNISLDDTLSMKEMEDQAKEENELTYDNNKLMRMDQFVIHKVGPVTEDGMRKFFKLSVSKDKYDLIGNAHNSLIDYKWEMRERSMTRNIPQAGVK